MSAIRSRNRPGSKSIPNWRMEDAALDAFDFRVACWMASHSDQYAKDHVTRNAIARILSISAGKVSGCLAKLEALGIVELETINVAQSEGGKRLVITFDHAVWEIQPRSPDDQAPVTTRPHPGHDVTAPIGTHGENQESSSSASAEVERRDFWEEAFENWYSTYPRKVGRPAAAKAFKAKLKGMSTGQMMQLSMGSLAWQRHWRESGTEMQFIPHPSTFLNQERYNDVPPARTNQPKPNTPMGFLAAIAERDHR